MLLYIYKYEYWKKIIILSFCMIIIIIMDLFI